MKKVTICLIIVLVCPMILSGASGGREVLREAGLPDLDPLAFSTPRTLSDREVHSIFTSRYVPGSLLSRTILNQASADGKIRHIQSDPVVDTVSVPTVITEEMWDTDVNTWRNFSRELYAYDGHANPTEVAFQTWMFVQWEYVQKSTLTYDLNDRVIKEVGQNWMGGVWQKSHQLTYTYGANGYLSSVIIQLWNGSSWDNFLRHDFSYDGNNLLTYYLEKAWNGSAWINNNDYTGTYDGSGNLTNILQRRWEVDAWVDVTSRTYTFDGSNRETSETRQYWDGGTWLYEVRYLSTYNAEGFLDEYLRQNWVASAWMNVTREYYLYDMNGNRTDVYGDEWIGYDWIYDFVTYNIYDAGDNIVESFSQAWTGSDWVNSEKITYSRETIVTPATVTQNYDVLSKWNMVSVPLTVSANDKDAVFPTSVSNAFYFNAGYTVCQTLQCGVGYWLKFDTSQTVSITGVMRLEDTVDVVAGWNMVGSIGVPIAAASVGSIPGGLVSSAFFGFDAGYQAASTIEPGKGYWVKMAEAGKLVLSASGNVPASARVRMELTDVRPPAPPEEPATVESAPVNYALDQNFPNPFNPVTEIRYSLAEAGHVRISAFNVLGQEVAVLVDGLQEAGEQSVAFDGAGLPSGVYFYTIRAGDFTGMRRMVLLK